MSKPATTASEAIKSLRDQLSELVKRIDILEKENVAMKKTIAEQAEEFSKLQVDTTSKIELLMESVNNNAPAKRTKKTTISDPINLLIKTCSAQDKSSDTDEFSVISKALGKDMREIFNKTMKEKTELKLASNGGKAITAKQKPTILKEAAAEIWKSLADTEKEKMKSLATQ